MTQIFPSKAQFEFAKLLSRCSLTKDLNRERKKVQAQKNQNAKGKAVEAELRNARNTITKLKKQHKIDKRNMMRSQHHKILRKNLFSIIKTRIFHHLRMAFTTWRDYTHVCSRTIICIEVQALANSPIHTRTQIKVKFR